MGVFRKKDDDEKPLGRETIADMPIHDFHVVQSGQQYILANVEGFNPSAGEDINMLIDA